jgi:hypothetical protein
MENSDKRGESGMTRPMDEIDLETPEVDAAEQSIAAVPSWQDHDADESNATVAEATEWDAQEQRRTVEFDEDDR